MLEIDTVARKNGSGMGVVAKQPTPIVDRSTLVYNRQAERLLQT